MTELQQARYAALVLRVTMGLLFLAHGFLLKVMTFGVAGTVGFFESIGYPAALDYAVIAVETVGGIMLIVGAYSRYVSLALIPVMLGALLVHLPNGWVFASQNGGWEFPAFWTAILVAQVLLGDGAHALRPAALPGGRRQHAPKPAEA